MTDRTCEVDGCEGRHLAHGLCQGHYSRHRRGLDIGAPLRAKRPITTEATTCKADQCSERGTTKDLCPRHYELQYRAETRKARRGEWIAKQGGVCVTCGSTDRLEIDHRNPAEKSCEVEQIWFRTAEARAVELAKCQVLCRDCHLAKSKVDLRGIAKRRSSKTRPRAA